jgi:hypothetical protein
MGTGPLPGVKRLRPCVDHPPEVKERVELYLYSPWAFEAGSRMTFTSTFIANYTLYFLFEGKYAMF